MSYVFMYFSRKFYEVIFAYDGLLFYEQVFYGGSGFQIYILHVGIFSFFTHKLCVSSWII